MVEDFSKHEAGGWMDPHSTEFKDESVEDERERELNEVADRFEENVEMTKATIDKMGGEEALNEALKNNPEVAVDLADAYAKIVTGAEGLFLAAVGSGIAAFGSSFNNVLENMNGAEHSVTNPGYQGAAITAAGIVGLLYGCSKIIAALREKKLENF